MSGAIDIEIAGSALVIRFTRPEIRNRLSVSVLAELREIVRDIRSNGKVQRIIFTGTGDVFASGADLREIAGVGPQAAKEFAENGQTLMRLIDELPQMTIAAINGYCFGGALDLTLACDRRVASPHATFAHPGSGLGIITGWGGTQRLPRLVGTAIALELFFTASPINAKRALAIGLIDETAIDPVQRALELGPEQTIITL